MLFHAAAFSIRVLTAWVNYGGGVKFDTLSEHIYSQHRIKHGTISILGLYTIRAYSHKHNYCLQGSVLLIIDICDNFC